MDGDNSMAKVVIIQTSDDYVTVVVMLGNRLISGWKGLFLDFAVHV